MNDIRKLFPTYRWRWTDDHEPGQRFDPWHVEIPGRYGYVYLHAETPVVMLQAYSDRRGVFARLRALPGVTVWQEGTDELTVLFRPEDAEPVMALLRSHRKPAGRSADEMAEIRPRPGRVALPDVAAAPVQPGAGGEGER